MSDEGGDKIERTFGISIVKDDILSFDITELAQAKEEGLFSSSHIGCGGSAHVTYARKFCRLRMRQN